MNHPQQNRKKPDLRSRPQSRGFKRINWRNELKPEWITKSIDEGGIKFSEKLGDALVKNKLTTSQIRNIYGEMKRIQMKGFNNEITSFLLLLPKIAYASKRKEEIGIKIFKDVFDKMHSLVKNEKHYENMMNLMEAILAYHKAFGGKE